VKIELKRLAISLRLSQETIAFAADVYVDGKKAGFAGNDGHGGSTNVHIQPRELADRVEAYGKTLVPAEYKFVTGTEWLVDELIEAELQRRHDAKEAKRIAKYDALEAAKFAKHGMLCARVRAGDSYVWAGFKPGGAEATKEHLTKKYGSIAEWVVVSGEARS
jgi:hypothetical protein